MAEPVPGAVKTELDAYVAAPDDTYHYTIEKTLKEATYTGYIVRMQSQKWLTEEEVDRVVWEHDVRIVVPKEVKTDVGLLFIGGGANGRDVPDSVKKEFAEIAVASGSVVTELGQVPNQPLVFAADPEKRPRVEDELIGFAWKQYLEGKDERWLPRLPMTKSAVRAMDTITEVCAKEAEVPVKHYVVAGGSKRGWTTWTTGAVDKRVKAIVPIVIDMLNVRPSFQHHYQAYGFFAPAVDDYVENGIMEWQDTERYAQLLKVVEPYEYRSRFTMPKLMLNGTGDQFFLPDSSQFYFDQLPGEKHLRYVPNADHSLKKTDAYETLLAYYAMILADVPRPEFTWELPGDGSIKVQVANGLKPNAVKLWQASNAEARDFRKETIGNAWTSRDLKEDSEGVFVAKVGEPEKGWTAFMVELTFPTPAKVPLKLTTAVDVIPRTLPHPPFEPKRK